MDALHHWVIGITVAIPLHFVPENFCGMVVEITPSILKDDHQGRRGPSCEYSTTVDGGLLVLRDVRQWKKDRVGGTRK